MTRAKAKASGQDKDGMRGRHKRARSPEVKRWESEHLLPTRPAWMPPQVYSALARLRDAL